MLRTTVGLSRVALLASWLLLVVVVCPAMGQGIQSEWELGPSLANVVYVAQPPAEAPKEKLAPPPLADELLQPPKPKPVAPPLDLTERPSPPSSRRPIVRLAGMPNMFGDFCGSLTNAPPNVARGKVAENNKALPMDRTFFMYNHFHNALESIVPGTGPYSIDRYTLGLEKTFCCGLYSVEVRMPLVGELDYAEPGFQLDTGVVGNLGVGVKRLLYATPTSAAAVGMYVETPTGENVTASTPTSHVLLHNDAVHLLPYIGFLSMPGDTYFFQGFLQLDVAANDHRVDVDQVQVGKYHEQNLLFADLSVGRWLYRNPRADRLRDLAFLVEYHYVSTLQDTDLVGIGIPGAQISLRNLYNRMDVSNVTVGFHARIGRTTVRVGGAFPVADRENQLFDGEVQVSINRYF
jgi:hypothetical protein